MIQWFQSILAALTGRLTIDKYVYAQERWFYYKNECERLAKASAYHEERANAAVRMLNEAERRAKGVIGPGQSVGPKP